MSVTLDGIKEAVVVGKFKETEAMVQEAIEAGVDLDALLNDALIAAMDVVGAKFSDGRIFVPEMLLSAETMKRALNLVKPLLKSETSTTRGTVIMATVKGDQHDIGKNLVSMMLDGAGFEVVDLGVDLSAEKLIDRVAEIRPQVLGLSALLTTTMPEMKNVIDGLAGRGLKDEVKVMIGGAPVSQEFADSIGADGYGQDAPQAVELARRWTTG